MLLGLLIIHTTLLDLMQFVHNKLKLPFSRVRGFWAIFIGLYQFMGANLQTQRWHQVKACFWRASSTPQAQSQPMGNTWQCYGWKAPAQYQPCWRRAVCSHSYGWGVEQVMHTKPYILCHVQLAQSHFSCTCCVDYRTQKDHMEWCTITLDAQMEYLLCPVTLTWLCWQISASSEPVTPPHHAPWTSSTSELINPWSTTITASHQLPRFPEPNSTLELGYHQYHP